MNLHEHYIFDRIQESQFPLRVWVNLNGILCAGPDYPEGSYSIVGTYDRNITEAQFEEDLRFARTQPEMRLEA